MNIWGCVCVCVFFLCFLEDITLSDNPLFTVSLINDDLYSLLLA